MKILVYPKDSNPYQSLLYDAMKKEYPSTRIVFGYSFPLVGSLPLLIFAPAMRSLGFKIIHIHWPSFGTRFPLPFNQRLSRSVFLITLKWLRLLRFKLVWTVHNVLPHEPQTKDDLSLMRLLSIVSDAKIVHSSFTVKQMEDLGLDTSETLVIPHGNYLGTYPDKISASEARSRLKLDPASFVILFFGQIRPYKGIENLLTTFESISAKNARLIIAGKCEDEDLKLLINDAKGKANVDFYDGRVSDPDVAMYFKASDVVCLPFKAITTSGSALLALSFGKPLIAPSSGALAEFPKDIGYIYNPLDPAALAKCLKQSMTDKKLLVKMGANGLKFAQTLDWSDISKRTYAIYERILS